MKSAISGLLGRLYVRAGLASASVIAAPAQAQGFVRGFQNATNLVQIGVGFMTIVGVLAGLGVLMYAMLNAYKKGNGRAGDDVTWGGVAIQITVGGLLMALGFVGINVVEILGGSASDIGRAVR